MAMRIEFKTDTPAFKTFRVVESGLILRTISNKLLLLHSINSDDGVIYQEDIFDIDGNKIGTWSLD